MESERLADAALAVTPRAARAMAIILVCDIVDLRAG
jgi:hypothetical protein